MMSGTLTSISTSRAVILGWLEKEMICSLDVSRVSVAIAVVLAYSLFVTVFFLFFFTWFFFFFFSLFFLLYLVRLHLLFSASFLFPSPAFPVLSRLSLFLLSLISLSLSSLPLFLSISPLYLSLSGSLLCALSLSLFQYLSCFPTLH